MVARYIAGFCCAASLLCSGQTLRIRLYDYAGLKKVEAVDGAWVAGLVLRRAGIAVTWIHCRGAIAAPHPDPECQSELRSNEIVMTLTPRPRSPGKKDTLGYAEVREQGGDATVVIPVVRRQTEVLGASFDRLLGYTIAHEAVHCLLGPVHSKAGLMRPGWNREDGATMAKLMLGLSGEESRRAVAVVARLTPRT